MLNQLRNDSAFVPELDYSLQKAAGLGAVHYALRGILIFMAKADSDRQASLAFAIMDLMRGEDASFFLCKELISGYLDGVTGEYAPPEGYFVDEKAVEEFDRQFLYKEKKDTARTDIFIRRTRRKIKKKLLLKLAKLHNLPKKGWKSCKNHREKVGKVAKN